MFWLAFLAGHHDVISLSRASPALALNVFAVSFQRIKANDDVAGRNVDAFLQYAGGHKQIALTLSKLLHNFSLLHAEDVRLFKDVALRRLSHGEIRSNEAQLLVVLAGFFDQVVQDVSRAASFDEHDACKML